MYNHFFSENSVV